MRFREPQTIALGKLNLSYPDAVHVLAAVWRAEDAGLLLPHRGRADGSGSLAFYRAAAAVKKFGTKLTDTPGGERHGHIGRVDTTGDVDALRGRP